MQRFEVDDDLVAIVWERAKPRPFETLSFSAALRRALLVSPVERKSAATPAKISLDELIARAKASAAAQPKKAPSPSVSEWVASVPELKRYEGLNTWKAVCDALGVDPAGDSARRKLKVWVSSNRPAWPEVPGV